MAARKQKGPTPVDAITHADKRPNIPTADAQEFVSPEIEQPKQVRWPRDPTLDPQLVWKGKDELDSEDLVTDADVAAENGWAWPSYPTVYRRWMALPPAQRLAVRIGTKAAADSLAMPIKRDKTSLRPLDLVNDGHVTSRLIMLKGIPVRVMHSYVHQKGGYMLSADFAIEGQLVAAAADYRRISARHVDGCHDVVV